MPACFIWPNDFIIVVWHHLLFFCFEAVGEVNNPDMDTNGFWHGVCIFPYGLFKVQGGQEGCDGHGVSAIGQGLMDHFQHKHVDTTQNETTYKKVNVPASFLIDNVH